MERNSIGLLLTRIYRTWLQFGALMLLLMCGNIVIADHGPEHESTVSTPGGGQLTVSPAIIVNEGVVRYTYTPGADFPDSYPSWERLTYKSGTLYYTQGYRPSDPFFYFFRPVRWGTFSFAPNVERCPRAPEGASSEVILQFARQCDAMIGCNARDNFCELKVRADRREGEDWRGHFWPNCRAQYYLGPFPDTSGGGSQATSRINLFLRDSFDGFDPQVVNPLTLTSSGPMPDCPDPDPFVPEDPSIEFSCDDANGDQPSIEIEENQDVPSRVDFTAFIENVCEAYAGDFGFGGGSSDDCNPEFEFCEEDIYTCIDQSHVNWTFGDGNSEDFTYPGDTISNDYEDAGDFVVTATVQPFGVSTQCQLKLNPPGVRVDVRPSGTKLAIDPDTGGTIRRTTAGSAFAMDVVIRTTDGFGKVKNLTFEDSNLLSFNDDFFDLLEQPTLPIVPAEVPPETTFFEGRFVLEAVAQGEGDIGATVNYLVANQQKSSSDSELVSVGVGLKVDLFAKDPANLGDSLEPNAFPVEIEVENIGEIDLLKLAFEDGQLLAQSVPGSAAAQGELGIVKQISSLPAQLAPGEKVTLSGVLKSLIPGDVRIAAIINAEDSDGNYFEIGKGADLRISEEATEEELAFWNNLQSLIKEGFDESVTAGQDVVSKGEAMLDHMVETAAAGGNIDAASAGLADSCNVPNSTAPLPQPEPDLFDKKLAEQSYVPDFIKQSLSAEARAQIPELEYVAIPLAKIIAKEDATTEFVNASADTIGSFGTLAGHLSVEHNRDQLANSVMTTLKELPRNTSEGWGIIVDAYYNDDENQQLLIDNAFGEQIVKAETAVRGKCQEMAGFVSENNQLLKDGKYAEYHYNTSKVVQRAGLEVTAELATGFGSAKVLKEGSERFSKTVAGKYTKQLGDTAGSKYRAATKPLYDKYNRKIGQYDQALWDRIHSGPMGRLAKRRLRNDRVAPSPATRVTADAIDSPPDFPGYVGGLGPEEQVAWRGVAEDLQNYFDDALNTAIHGDRYAGAQVEIQLTPTNPFASPEWRRANGRPLGTPKEESIKAKAINFEDVELGAPQANIGEVGMFDPDVVWETLPPAKKARLKPRRDIQKKVYNDFLDSSSSLRQNIDLASGDTPYNFDYAVPSPKKNKPIYDRDGKPISLPPPEPRQVRQHYAVEVSNDTQTPTVLLKDRLNDNRPIVGDQDGHHMSLIAANGDRLEIPPGLKAPMRSRLRSSARDRAGTGHLRLADHGATLFGADFVEKASIPRFKMLLERLPAPVGRQLAREWVDFQNKLIRRDHPGLSPEALAEKLLDYDDFTRFMEFGTKLTSITANNVKVVDGSGNPFSIIKRNVLRGRGETE